MMLKKIPNYGNQHPNIVQLSDAAPAHFCVSDLSTLPVAEEV